MQSMIIGLVDGEPDNLPMENHLDGGLPAIEVEAAQTLDGNSVYHGTAAGTVMRRTEIPIIHDDGITTEREEVTDQATVNFIADFDTGFVGIDTSKGEFFWRMMEAHQGIRIARAIIDLRSLRDHLLSLDSVDAWQVGWKDGDDGAGTLFHDDAELEAGSGELTQLGVKYFWDGNYVDATIAASGYAAVYSDLTAEQYSAWVGDVLLPHAMGADTEDEFLEEATETDDEQQTLGGESA